MRQIIRKSYIVFVLAIIGASCQTTTIQHDKKEGTVLVLVNSICGCAAGSCRPGALLSLENEKKPDFLTTVFAGQDKEATERARAYMLPYPPSSPSIALFKNGELVHFVERHNIEGHLKEAIAENLSAAYDEFC